MLNSIIKIDLHIHSQESNYKEDDDIVCNGTIENLDVLFEKLNTNEINMFSITDHNRFNNIIYEKAKELIDKKLYPNVKAILPGVEFDVLLEEDVQIKSETKKGEKYKACHIITIFDAKSNQELKRIHDCIESEENILKNKDDFYEKKHFESILREIGLDTILIVHQKQSLDRKDKSHRSLSGAVKNPYEIIEMGYINALEFKKSSVEGILKDNLKKIERNVSLITGSDCHQWDFYPEHDEKSKSVDFNFTTLKCLPTFKGLLMSITSPKTRINIIPKENSDNYLNEFKIGKSKINLDPGINVIVGENGSGKSTLLNLICPEKSRIKPYIKKLKEVNSINIDHPLNADKTLFVKQADIIDKTNKGNLFDNTLYKVLNHELFIKNYQTYASKIKEYIEYNIKLKETYDELGDIKIKFDSSKEKPTYYIQGNSENLKPKDYSDIEIREKMLKNILLSLKMELSSEYYSYYEKNMLKQAYTIIFNVYKEIQIKLVKLNIEKSLVTIILNGIKKYNINIGEKSTSQDSQIQKYRQEKNKIVERIKNYIVLSNKNNKFPKSVEIIKNVEKNKENGYTFISIAKYNEEDMQSYFLQKMFLGTYQNIDALKSINSIKLFSEAIAGCGKPEDINSKWKGNLEKFLEEMKEDEHTIREGNGDNKEGGTLGEISLTYYKYHLNSENKQTVVCIDQPEDNISNNLINTELIKYLNVLRKEKQIFIVTHNPLLVVNLDADNVLILNNSNSKITCKYGCLEDEKNGILEYVADKMDGGRESIERRYKLYGKKYKNRNDQG
jgi:hypothetical protein